jgi:hypothetical protein
MAPCKDNLTDFAAAPDFSLREAVKVLCPVRCSREPFLDRGNVQSEFPGNLSRRPPRTMQFSGIGSPPVELEAAITRSRCPVVPVDSGHEQQPFAAHGALVEATAANEGVAKLEIHEAEQVGVLDPQGHFAAQSIPEPFRLKPMHRIDGVIETPHRLISQLVSSRGFVGLVS